MDKIKPENLYQIFKWVKKVSIDTRNIEHGSIFFALKGPNFNANQFAGEALEKGASYVVVDEKEFKLNEKCILVNNTLLTLQDLANYHRKKFEIPFIAITGSNGKTTTRELARDVLSQKYKVSATSGNLNNHIGVPLTLLSLNDDDEIAIIEMGANHLGEINRLCEIAEPTHGLITNIGKAHTEGFGDVNGVIRGKSELFQYLIQHEGEVFINSQDHILFNMAKRFKNPILYPSKGDYYHCEFLKSDPFIQLNVENGETLRTQQIGKYNFENIAAALCLGKYFDIPQEKAHHAIIEYVPKNNRSQVIIKDGNTIILDAYNANPDSMEVAIENLKSMDHDFKILILGDMNELGDISEKEHGILVEKTNDHGFDEILLCGNKIEKSSHINPNSKWFKSVDDLSEFLIKKKYNNSLILIKASRSIGLEKVVEVI